MAVMATVTTRPLARRVANGRAGEVHLAEQPAAENVAVRIGVGRHGDGADRRVGVGRHFGLGRLCGGIGHGIFLSVCIVCIDL